jgi:hypothetical protein
MRVVAGFLGFIERDSMVDQNNSETQRLKNYFSSKFLEVDCPPRASFDLRCGPKDDDICRFIFRTFVAQTDSAHGGDARLVDHFIARFDNALDILCPDVKDERVLTILWRTRPVIEYDRLPLLGPMVAPAEAVRDGLVPEPRLPDYYKRFDDDCYYELHGWQCVVRLRMRLCIPEMNWRTDLDLLF